MADSSLGFNLIGRDVSASSALSNPLTVAKQTWHVHPYSG